MKTPSQNAVFAGLVCRCIGIAMIVWGLIWALFGYVVSRALSGSEEIAPFDYPESYFVVFDLTGPAALVVSGVILILASGWAAGLISGDRTS